MKNLSLKVKLMLTMMGLATFVSLGSQWIGYSQSKAMLTGSASKNLRGLAEAKKNHLIDQFNNFSKQLYQVASTPRNQYLLQELDSAFTTLDPKSIQGYKEDEAKESLRKFYDDQFIHAFKSKSLDNPIPSSDFLSKLTPQGIYLQYQYISRNPHKLGEKNNLFDAKDGSMWSAMHSETHPDQKQIVEALGLYDIFFINKDGFIVYSDFKELDFATSLVNGPFANSSLAEAYNLAKDSRDPKKTFITEMRAYYPSFQNAAVFMSIPVLSESQKYIGVIAIQLPTSIFDKILSSGQNWTELGLGKGGDIYIVNKNLTVLSSLREIQENKSAFLESLSQTDMNPNVIRTMDLKETTALLFDYSKIPEWKEIVSGKSGMTTIPNFLGDDKFVSYVPISYEGIDWYLVARENVADALSAVYDMQTFLTYFAIIVQIIVIFVSFYFATYLVAQIVTQIQKLHSAATDTEEAGSRIKDASERVSSSSTEQASAIQETVATLNQITAMVNKSVEGVEKSREKAESSHRVAEDGQAAVNEMVKSMEGINDANTRIMEQINESNKQITEIVDVISEISNKTKVINDIVFQTKLLSFNASVEAARAGEHGKGFAVVAEEVGNLAQMSGNAAKEIGDMLTQSIAKVEGIVENTKTSVTKLVEDGKAKVESGVVIANRCGEVLDQVVHNISDVRSNMDEIASASREQAEGVNNITAAMNELDQATHLNSEIAATTLTCSNDLNEASTELRTAIGGLKSLVFGPNAKATIITQNPSGKSVNKKGTPANVIQLESMKKKPANQPEISIKQPEKKAVGADYISANDPRFEDI